MDNINVFYVFGDNYGIIGNVTAPVNLYHASNIHNSHIAQGNDANGKKPLTDNEKELLRLFSELGIVEQSRVIDRMNKEELQALAFERGVEFVETDTKAMLIEKIRAAQSVEG